MPGSRLSRSAARSNWRWATAHGLIDQPQRARSSCVKGTSVRPPGWHRPDLGSSPGRPHGGDGTARNGGRCATHGSKSAEYRPRPRGSSRSGCANVGAVGRPVRRSGSAHQPALPQDPAPTARARGAARPTGRPGRPTPGTGRSRPDMGVTSSRKPPSGLTVWSTASVRPGRSVNSIARARAFVRVRTRSTVSTAPSLIEMIGLTPSSEPIAACGPLIRPPFLRYSSVSRQRRGRRRPDPRSSGRCRRPGRPSASSRRGSPGAPRPSTRSSSRRDGSRGRPAGPGRPGRS